MTREQHTIGMRKYRAAGGPQSISARRKRAKRAARRRAYLRAKGVAEGALGKLDSTFDYGYWHALVVRDLREH